MIVAVTLDGVEYDDIGFQEDRFQISYQAESYDYSQGLIAYGGAYDYLYQRFFDVDNAFEVTTQARIVLKCCNNTSFDFVLKANDIKFTPNCCEARIRLMGEDEARRKYDKLLHSLMWAEGYEDNNRYIKFPYAYQRPNWINDILIFLDRVLLGGLSNRLIGGNKGRYFTISPLVDQIKYHANRVGLVLESSILQGRYNRLCFLTSAGKGIDRGDVDQGSRLNLTVGQTFDKLKELFNGEVRLRTENGQDKVIFERKDLVRTDVLLADLDELIAADLIDKDNLPEYELYKAEQARPRVTHLFFQKDPIEPIGNIVVGGGILGANFYDKYIAHDEQLTNQTTKGAEDKPLNFSPAVGQRAHYATTAVEGDVNQRRESRGGGRLRHILVLGDVNGFQNIKPIMWDGTSSRNNARMSERQSRIQIAPDRPYFSDYNHELFLDDEGILPFHAIDFPTPDNNNYPKYFVSSEIKYIPDDFCRDSELIRQYKTDLRINCLNGTHKAYAEEITVDYFEKTISLRNLTVYKV